MTSVTLRLCNQPYYLMVTLSNFGNSTFSRYILSSQVVEETLGVWEGGRAVEGKPRGGEGYGVGAAHAAVVAAQGQPTALS